MPNHYTIMAVGSAGEEFDCAAFNAKHKKTNICQEVMPMPKELEGTTSPGDSPNWFDWQTEHWGIKWGTYDVEAFQLGGDGNPVLVKFQCPWGPPKILDRIAEWLKMQCGFDSVTFIGFNPFDNSTRML